MNRTPARREGRECAVQLLFELDLNPRPVEEAFQDYWAARTVAGRTDSEGLSFPSIARQADGAVPADILAFAEEAVRGVLAHRDEIDARLAQCAANWDVRRMAVTDRNVLRLAAYELMFRDDIPPVVSINEAVDLAKFFNNRESGRFVNGILDRMRKDLTRPARTAVPKANGRAKNRTQPAGLGDGG